MLKGFIMYFQKLLLISLFAILPTFLFSQSSIESENSLAVFYEVDKNIEKQYNDFISTKIKTIGFNLTDPHRRVNDQYEVQYGSTVLTLLSFMPVVNDKAILPLLNIEPQIAGFAPFNMLIYKKSNEAKTFIGHLQPKVMLDILKIQNKEVREKFTATFKPLNNLIEKEFKGKKSYMPYHKLPNAKMINFEYTFKAPEDIDDFVEEFQNSIELAFINKGYLIAGFHDFITSPENEDDILEKYDAFWTYSLCHLEFSYHMFDDNKGARPEAGLFAPCTMYMYIKKGTNTLVVGMYRLHNWSETLNITDKKRLSLVEKLDTQIPEILTAYGMKDTSKTKRIRQTRKNHHEINIVIPSVPKITIPSLVPKVPVTPQVPQAVHITGSYINGNRAIKFSKRVPPNYIAHSFDKRLKEKKQNNTRVGEVTKGFISAYLRGSFLSVENVKKKLKKAGFDIIASVPINKKGTLISIVFTNDELIKLASKTNREFASNLRVLIDTKEKVISITNPIYLTRGFLQEDYNEKIAKKLLYELLSQFSKLKNSKDGLRYKLLTEFSFMANMPLYEDMIEVASGEDLKKRIKNNKNVVFTQELLNGSTIIGVKLRKRANKFPKKIGRNNAAMLPYLVLIKDGHAKILNPKYYIAYMYPLLSMSKFMTISTVPDAIVKNITRILRKKRKKRKK